MPQARCEGIDRFLEVESLNLVPVGHDHIEVPDVANTIEEPAHCALSGVPSCHASSVDRRAADRMRVGGPLFGCRK